MASKRVSSVAQIKRMGSAGLLSLLVFAMGCATATSGAGWPDLDIGAQAPPEADSGEPRFVRGEDGMLYILGEIQARPGQMVLGRFGGDWPLQDTPPPALWAGQVLSEPEEGVFLVHPLYQFPKTKLEELAPEIVDELGDQTIGKGLAQVKDVDYLGPTQLNLSLGREEGVQRGDFYGIFRPAKKELSASTDGQLTRRLLGICMVVEMESHQSTCRLRVGHDDYAWAGKIEVGQQAIFLTPSLGRAPREGTILVSSVGEEEIDKWAMEHLASYFSAYPGGNVAVEPYDQLLDASDPEFHRWARRAQTSEPTLLLGLSLQERDGKKHLIANYTGLGSAVGAGMIAAPPEGGVDLGPVEKVSAEDWRGLSSVLMAGMLVYRGQEAEGLMHLHDALRDEALKGALRWHARDQFAMRWGGLERMEEAIWLVREDEAVAEANKDNQAYLNALGTRVRLHDFLKQPEQAFEAAKEYLEARKDGRGEGSAYLSALSMYAEMAIQNDAVEVGRQALEELLSLCPDGCDGDLFIFLAGIYWAAYGMVDDIQRNVVSRMLELATAEEETSLAGARMFQGWEYLSRQDQMQALIAFLEAERLFEEEGDEYGKARAQFYISVTQIGRGEPQQAFAKGMEALKFMTEVQDLASMARIYERLSEIYVDFSEIRRPEPYLGAATQILQENLQNQFAKGDYGAAAEAAFGLGHFLFRVRQLDEARNLFEQAVVSGLQVANFEITAMAYIFLALVAQAEGDIEAFGEAIGQAQVMSEAAQDPFIDELLEGLLNPGELEGDDPTQML